MLTVSITSSSSVNFPELDFVKILTMRPKQKTKTNSGKIGKKIQLTAGRPLLKFFIYSLTRKESLLPVYSRFHSHKSYPTSVILLIIWLRKQLYCDGLRAAKISFICKLHFSANKCARVRNAHFINTLLILSLLFKLN